MVLDKGSRCAQACVIIFTLFFWLTGFVLLFLGIWMLVDPKRNYLLDLVNFSEDEPLLKFAAYSCLAAGSITLVIGFLGCCGALKGVRCMLGTFVLFLLFLFLAELTIGVLALIFKDKVFDLFADALADRKSTNSSA
uniref:Tetraspanin n=1 Tax=Plectus sambesii TaxID=2011161 RepID=A0A914X2U9_9BILA